MTTIRDTRLDKLFIGYVRNSTEMQRDNFSAEFQREWCRRTAADRGWVDVSVREEQGISGQTIEQRPVFQPILADIERGIVGAVAAVDMNRFTRDEDLVDGL